MGLVTTFVPKTFYVLYYHILLTTQNNLYLYILLMT